MKCTSRFGCGMIMMAKVIERADAVERKGTVEVNCDPCGFFYASGCLRFSPTETWGVAELS